MLNSSSTPPSKHHWFVLGSCWSHYWPSLSCRQYSVSTFPGIIISRAFKSMSECKELILNCLHKFVREEIFFFFIPQVFTHWCIFPVIVVRCFYPKIIIPILQSPRIYFIRGYSSCIRYLLAVWFLGLLTPCMCVCHIVNVF